MRCPLLHVAPGLGQCRTSLPTGGASCSTFQGLAFLILLGFFLFPIQNSPELDEEGYSIRPEEPGYILWFRLCLLGYSLEQELGSRAGRWLSSFHYYYLLLIIIIIYCHLFVFIWSWHSTDKAKFLRELPEALEQRVI